MAVQESKGEPSVVLSSSVINPSIDSEDLATFQVYEMDDIAEQWAHWESYNQYLLSRPNSLTVKEFYSISAI